MTTATAEKPTCTYKIITPYAYTECGLDKWADMTKEDNYCANCGKKIERVKMND